MIQDLEPQRHSMEVRGPASLLWEMLANPTGWPREFGLWGRAGTAKSWNILTFLLWLAHAFPRVPGRVLIIRQTRTSLTSSACVTIRKILPPGHPALEGPSDEHRHGYDINAWHYALMGMDNPAKTYSTEWDIVYFQEAREISEGAYEESTRGLRNNAFYRYTADGELAKPGQGIVAEPFHFKVLDTNPDTTTSWMLKRAKAGILRFYQSIVQDNPAYWDLERGVMLPMGIENERQLEQLSGVRRLRLRDAVWCNQEGSVWPEYAPDMHHVSLEREDDGWISRDELKRWGITEFYCGVDFGIDNAGCLLLAGLTRDRKLIVIAEIYHSGKDLYWWRDLVRVLHEHYRITLGFCDHNRPDWIWAFNDEVGAPRTGPGTVFIPVDKGVNRGIEIVRRRMLKRDTGPHLFFDRNRLMHVPDPECLRRKIPWCTTEEIPDYTWARGVSAKRDDGDESKPRPEKPDKAHCHDNGCDALRYLCVGVEYIEPEPKLYEPVNKKFLALLNSVRVQAGIENDLLDDEEILAEIEDDYIQDQIQRIFAPEDV